VPNAYSGGTTITAGTLQISQNGAAGSGVIALSGGRLVLAGGAGLDEGSVALGTFPVTPNSPIAVRLAGRDLARYQARSGAALLAQDDQHLADEHITREAARLKTEVQSGVMLKVNLLGIFNYRSLSQLIKDGTLLCEPVSGSLTFTNKATARNISIAATPFAKIDKLQKVLMENVLFSLACHATGSAGSEELCVTHDFFEYKSRMDSRRFADDMNALVAMGLIDPQKEIEILKKSM